MNAILAIVLVTQFRYLTRAEIMDSTRPFAEVEWYCDSANVAPVPECPDWYPDYQAGHTYRGMAYEYGGWDRVGQFLANLDNGLRAGSHSDNDCLVGRGDPSWATGQDCSGLVSRAWQLPYKHSTGMLPDISHPIDWDALLPGDIIDWPRHHVVIFDSWADTDHVYMFIYQATDRRPNPSTTARDLRNRANYVSHYTPYRYNYLVDIEENISPENRDVVALVYDGNRLLMKFSQFTEGEAEVGAFDVAGRTVLRKTVRADGTREVEIELPRSGIYFVKVTLNGHVVISQKVIYFK